MKKISLFLSFLSLFVSCSPKKIDMNNIRIIDPFTYQFNSENFVLNDNNKYDFVVEVESKKTYSTGEQILSGKYYSAYLYFNGGKSSNEIFSTSGYIVTDNSNNYFFSVLNVDSYYVKNNIDYEFKVVIYYDLFN